MGKERILRITRFVLRASRAHSITLNTSLSEWQLMHIETRFRKSDDGGFLVTGIRVNKNGLHLVGEKGELRLVPDVWSEFWEELVNGDHEFTGRHAAKKWRAYERWLNDQNARIALDEIAGGRESFESLAKDLPEVMHHQAIKDSIVAHLLKGTWPKTRKKQDTITLREVELYNWATGYYLDSRYDLEASPLSWESACELACERHPNWVSSTWEKDPGGNLKRRVAPKLDNDPRYSQHSARQEDRQKRKDKK